MALQQHELKALAIELAASMPPQSSEEGNHISEIACIYWGAQAILDSLQDVLAKSERTKADEDRAYHLTMALDRSLQEIGRSAGAI